MNWISWLLVAGLVISGVSLVGLYGLSWWIVARAPEKSPRRLDDAGAILFETPARTALGCLALAGSLGTATIWLSWLYGGGLPGEIHLALFVAATLPGWPIGRALFGSHHAAAWMAGAAIGYGLTAVALWAVIWLRLPSAAAFVLAWAAVLSAMVWFGGLFPRPLIRLTPWDTRATAALLGVLLLVPALVGRPYLRIGERDAEGNRHYRAFFTADFLWHMALTSEVSRFAAPPVNPFQAPDRIHYYWTYFLLPAAIVGTHVPAAPLRIDQALRVNALLTGLLFVGTIFVTAWAAVPRAGPVFLAVLLTVLAASAEGAYALGLSLWGTGPMSRLFDVNVDALSSWVWHGLRIDGLPRALWYNPQHCMAAALGLVALMIGIGDDADPMERVAAAGAGIALGLATIMSPFQGAAFCVAYGVAITIRALAARSVRQVVTHSLAVIPLMVAIAWLLLNDVLEGASSALTVGWSPLAWRSPIVAQAVSLGPILVAVAAGLVAARGRSRRLVAAVAGLVVAFSLGYFVYLPADEAYVGFRSGQLFLVTAPALVAVAIDRAVVAGYRGAMAVSFAVLLLLGLPTTLVDAYDAQDISTAGERADAWTLRVTPDEQAAWEWIRTSTHGAALVQMEPTSRQASRRWSIIPSFAERRMAAALPISLLHSPEHVARTRRAQRLFVTHRASEAWEIASELKIDYVYLDRTDQAKLELGAYTKFARAAHLFHPVFVNDEVQVYAVLRRPAH